LQYQVGWGIRKRLILGQAAAPGNNTPPAGPMGRPVAG
jgi:hypothetical protein